MKKYLYVVPLILLFCFTIACQDKTAMAELEKYRAQSAVEAQNIVLVRGFWSAIDKNDFAKLRELTADGFSIKAPGLAEPMKLEDVFQAIKTHYAAFPDWTHTIEDMVVEGDKVAVKLLQSGTHKGVFEGIPPSDKKLTLPTLCLMVIAGGKIRELWALEDHLGFYQQLGMELKPIEAKKK
jgi:predicted ester cyclase